MESASITQGDYDNNSNDHNDDDERMLMDYDNKPTVFAVSSSGEERDWRTMLKERDT